MAFHHDDLLTQARYLATCDPKRPKQVNLRRAASAAYYSLFHFLVSEAVKLYVKNPESASLLSRVYGHGEMKEVSERFARGHIPKRLAEWNARQPVPKQLKFVAETFVVLQKSRHEADYDLAAIYARAGVIALVDRVTQAFEAWQELRAEDWSRLYLACFLNWKQWDKDYR